MNKLILTFVFTLSFGIVFSQVEAKDIEELLKKYKLPIELYKNWKNDKYNCKGLRSNYKDTLLNSKALDNINFVIIKLILGNPDKYFEYCEDSCYFQELRYFFYAGCINNKPNKNRDKSMVSFFFKNGLLINRSHLIE